MSCIIVQSDAVRLPLSDRSVDLVFGSPPYMQQRLYIEEGKDLGISRNLDQWVEWMLEVTTEALRISRGAVIWVAAGPTKDRNYQPCCEALMYLWARRGGSMYRPCFWHRVGIPGSGGDQWFRADVEYVMCFKRPGPLLWADNVACGNPPKWAPGGEMSHRVSDGTRVNQWGGHEKSSRSRRADGSMQEPGRPSHQFAYKNAFGVRTDVPVGTRQTGLKDASKETYRAHTKRRTNGEMEDQFYMPPVKANPGNLIVTLEDEEPASSLIHTNVGGGQLGSMHAHLNEAPFPEDLVEFFVRSLCPLDGIVLDPFVGSGTSVAVAERLGRHGIGLDLRRSQCELAKHRLERPHARVVRAARADEAPMPLFDRKTDRT